MRLSGIKWNEWNGMRLTENAMKLGKKKELESVEWNSVLGMELGTFFAAFCLL